MSSGDSDKLAALCADEVVREHCIQDLAVDVKALAAKLQIPVMPKPADQQGVSGMLIRLGNNYGIAYATHIDSSGFQRFSIAHELGHYFLPGHLDAVFGSSDIHQSRAGFGSGDRYELEADHFAAALLMPKALFKAAMKKAGEGAAGIVKLAAVCDTSLPATAIRYTQLTTDPMAIVVSTGESIDYCFMSDELMELKGIDWIRKRQGVPLGTMTAAFNRDPGKIRGAERVEGTSTLSAWFGGTRVVELQEDVIGLGTYGKTLTVLHGVELPDEDDEEEERSLRDSWTPRFRR